MTHKNVAAILSVGFLLAMTTLVVLGFVADPFFGQMPMIIRYTQTARRILAPRKSWPECAQPEEVQLLKKEKPVVEADNDMFKSGPIGMMGITTGASYYDNIVVAENINDIAAASTPVSSQGKLTSVWGAIKN